MIPVWILENTCATL